MTPGVGSVCAGGDRYDQDFSVTNVHIHFFGTVAGTCFFSSSAGLLIILGTGLLNSSVNFDFKLVGSICLRTLRTSYARDFLSLGFKIQSLAVFNCPSRGIPKGPVPW